jgi:acylphosphatase
VTRDDVVARRLTVHGRVQGVNFRAWVRDRARRRGVAGWAENRPDGAVELWLQGPREVVEELEREVAEGPRHGRVDHLDTTDAAPRDDLHGFERR